MRTLFSYMSKRLPFLKAVDFVEGQHLVRTKFLVYSKEVADSPRALEYQQTGLFLLPIQVVRGKGAGYGRLADLSRAGEKHHLAIHTQMLAHDVLVHPFHTVHGANFTILDPSLSRTILKHCLELFRAKINDAL